MDSLWLLYLNFETEEREPNVTDPRRTTWPDGMEGKVAVKSLRDKPPEVCLHRIFPTKSDCEWTTSAGSSVAANDVALVGPECSIEQ